MKEALFYKKLKKGIVQCQLCPNYCTIKDEEVGKCRTRKNIKGKLYSLSYGKPISIAVDPIEKKPLYHFLPGHKSLSFGTAGCTMHCVFCQNWEISQASPEDFPTTEVKPEEIIQKAKEYNCKSIAYTYTDCVAFYEYTLDIAKLAKKNKIKNIIVTCGYINQKPLKKLIKYLDAANIDLKYLDNDLYKKYSQGQLQPILDTIKTLHKSIWIEITNLLISDLNDKDSQVRKLAKWIKDNLGEEVPLHFSAFHPSYKMLDRPPTSPETVKKARELAMQVGLKYVYTGNIIDSEGSTTYCPKCKESVIKRTLFSVTENNLDKHRCKIAGLILSEEEK